MIHGYERELHCITMNFMGQSVNLKGVYEESDVPIFSNLMVSDKRIHLVFWYLIQL